MWHKNDDGAARTLDEATNYCKTLSLAGHSDWELPTEDQMLSLWSYGRFDKTARSTVFLEAKSAGSGPRSAQSGAFWLSSTVSGVLSFFPWPATGSVGEVVSGPIITNVIVATPGGALARSPRCETI